MEMEPSPVLLRRAHLVLAYLLHFYVHSLPPTAPVSIPRSISLPLLRVSTILDLPPLLTFADTVLYNWVHKTPSDSAVPAVQNLRTKTMFTGLIDEEEFYLCSGRIELRGVEALELMRATMDEIFIGDATAVRRITDYLATMAGVINELKVLLQDVRKECDPDIYYNEVRPWFRGEDSDTERRKWVFEGLEEDPSLAAPTELSGPSAGQSSMVHVLDIFLGVKHQSPSPDKPSFMSRMQRYMPRNHRLFLDHLNSNPRPLRAFVMASENAELHDAFNRVVVALKEFRDAHMIIATLYILGPARRAAKQIWTNLAGPGEPLKGTGGTDLVKFLKDTRSRTTETIIP
jgi:indoleamine 2,3-dioxygenase